MAQRWLDQDEFNALLAECHFVRTAGEYAVAAEAVKAFIRATLAGRPRGATAPPRNRRQNRQVPQAVQTPVTTPPPLDIYESFPEVSGYAATLLEEQPPHVRLPESYPRRDELLQWAGWEPAARPLEPPLPTYGEFVRTPVTFPAGIGGPGVIQSFVTGDGERVVYASGLLGGSGPAPVAPPDPPVLHSAHNGDPDTTNHD